MEVGYLINDAREWIRIALLCETLSCLPNYGGLFQQEREHVWKLEKVYQARNQRQLDESKEKSRG